jgi:PAS domain S-box-containing protein
MPSPLHVLLVEDSLSDAELLVDALRADDFEPIGERVQTPEEMQAALARRGWDVILCDYTLPAFGAVDALRLLQASGLPTPLIVVSGTIGEELAVAVLKQGASDYLLKDRLTRLGSSVRRAMAHAQMLQERQATEENQRQTLHALALEKARLVAAQAVAKVGSWEKDLTTGQVSWSEETHRIFETDPDDFPPSHAGILERVHPADRTLVDEAFVRSMERLTPSTIEHRVLLADGRVKILEERWQVIFDQQDRPLRAVGTCQDITDRKIADAALRESEERFRIIFEQAGIGIAMVGVTDGRILKCNRALAEMLGWSRDELCQLTVEAVSLPGDYVEDRRQWSRVVAREIPRYQMEKCYRHKDGHLVWGLLTSTVVRDAGGVPQFVIGMVEAIADRKRAEAERWASAQQLHALVVRLNTVREEEAKRIARELHDDLGQQLTALNMEISHLQCRWAAAVPSLAAELVGMRHSVDHMILAVQKIAGELRLGQLDLLGLPAAIQTELTGFQNRSGLQCTIVRLDETADLGEAEATAIFRIMQEALTNIARHAGADRVELSLRAEGDHVRLEISDNGRGITAAQLADRQAFGLLGMRERAEALGGTLSILGRPGQGTVILVELPAKSRG